ncbi:2-succinyl-5-enolpyruvyl-6-hydroxy-3-cyclohexene-1-carboxylic-acid synthase [Lutibacter sp. TH_r2]|uniref:2-succinyl-5-enolpyruvyl-6-hydroxy-3- cyclohexene-1-carboxylic-acid synthase n=1 Tax=Lutibacter sp. TH_r2 TaxID=3082083 RepID=UPI0029534775|nr:2-succinyl-5-enolpyruvyl-6-hydroxy-3-cyclohexene-1-carboxylic-acid synthase [Lutibacter sp. TH_r2]MDV7187342.1 2-succinyl-5-enolpyruvyl-6-hydroxy-3-cyclohexene-1-carboxylic-acid synthase [Lutibacter sp. TH_r2]
MPQYPKNKLAQSVIASCIANSVKHIVISPGSRNAPLTIGFSNYPTIKTYSIVDERSAGFFALGLAQQLQQPVAVVCTSGSALLNYYPAVAEAFYSDIPLVVISADRPKHLIDIGDGQTIRQEHVFSNHILYEANLAIESDHSFNLNEVNLALSISKNNQGPVHINVPFDEPLYETTSSLIQVETKKQLVENKEEIDYKYYAEIWNKASKKIVLVGQHFPNKQLQQYLEEIVKDPSVLVLVENTANVSHPNFINSIDKLIFPFEEDQAEAFQADIVISIGGLIVSKKIKQHLRNFKPKHHWHVDSKKALDTFLCLTKHFKTNSSNFFSKFIPLINFKESNYQQFWMEKKSKRLQNHASFLSSCKYSDLKVFETILNAIPANIQLQVGNSSVIRYTQLFDIHTSIKVFCNRGTSGIDGSTSTAIGASVAVKEQTIFITGDISFFYDSNALWNTYIPSNFRIILINNNGGGIFRFIPGPQQSNALNYFETPHNLTAKPLSKLYNLEYSSTNTIDELQQELKVFFKNSEKAKILEVFTPQNVNDKVLKAYFKNLKA